MEERISVFDSAKRDHSSKASCRALHTHRNASNFSAPSSKGQTSLAANHRKSLADANASCCCCRCSSSLTWLAPLSVFERRKKKMGLLFKKRRSGGYRPSLSCTLQLTWWWWWLHTPHIGGSSCCISAMPHSRPLCLRVLARAVQKKKGVPKVKLTLRRYPKIT